MYKIRLGGTNEFVSKIDPLAAHCYPIGEVTFVEGWNNPEALSWSTKTSAERATSQIFDIEGFHCTVEKVADTSSVPELQKLFDDLSQVSFANYAKTMRN